MKETASGKLGIDRELSSGLRDDPEGWMGVAGRLEREEM